MWKRKTVGYDAYQRGAETESFPSCYVSIVVVQKQLRKGQNESAPDRQMSVEIRKKHENMRVYLAYRSCRICSGHFQCDFHGVDRRLQKDRKLVWSLRPKEVRIESLEADDIVETIFQSELFQSLSGVNSVRVREDLKGRKRKIELMIRIEIHLEFDCGMRLETFLLFSSAKCSAERS